MHKGQLLVADGIFSLFLAIILAYSLFAAWPQERHPTGELTLERAGYDMVNAFYQDETIYLTVRKGLEVKGYLSPSEINYLRMRLYNYGRLLGVSRIDVEIQGSAPISVEVTSSVPTRVERFPLIIPLKGGADNRIVEVSLWR